MLETLIAQLFLVAVTTISAAGGVYATYVSRKATNATAAKADAESQHIENTTWINRLDALSRDLEKLQTLSDERFSRIVEVETLITEHVIWDFKMVRQAREHGWPVDDPPSLVYVRKKLEEEREVIRREMNGNEPGR